MPVWLKLLTGIAATGLVANAGYRFEAQALLARLGAAAAPVLLAHGITDASIRWNEGGWTYRNAHITATATDDPAAALAAVAALPGINAATFTARESGAPR